MNTPFDSERWLRPRSAANGLAVAVPLQAEIAPVAEQVASRQFASAPFGGGNDDERQACHLLDGWCAVASNASEVRGGAPKAAAFVCESPAFAEAVAELRREWLRSVCRPGHARGASCLESFYVGAQQPYSRNTEGHRRARGLSPPWP